MEEISHFQSISEEKFDRIFTQTEIDYAKKFSNYQQHLAGMFCAKEALVKALDNKNLIYNKISIEHTQSGRPFFLINNYLKSILDICRIKSLNLSISHTNTHAIAVVTIFE